MYNNTLKEQCVGRFQDNTGRLLTPVLTQTAVLRKQWALRILYKMVVFINVLPTTSYFLLPASFNSALSAVFTKINVPIKDSAQLQIVMSTALFNNG